MQNWLCCQTFQDIKHALKVHSPGDPGETNGIMWDLGIETMFMRVFKACEVEALSWKGCGIYIGIYRPRVLTIKIKRI